MSVILCLQGHSQGIVPIGTIQPRAPTGILINLERARQLGPIEHGTPDHLLHNIEKNCLHVESRQGQHFVVWDLAAQKFNASWVPHMA